MTDEALVSWYCPKCDAVHFAQPVEPGEDVVRVDIPWKAFLELVEMMITERNEARAVGEDLKGGKH